MIDSDFKVGMMGFLGALGLLFATVVAIMALDAYRDCQYIKAGYTHKMLPGEPCPQWVKEPSYGAYNKEGE